MDIYLVGGAVRDQLLGLPVKDRDWLVVGATAGMLLTQGYKQVGSDFPVFLHPKSQEEYALARTERKSGQGYNGFICDFSPEITLNQDLQRRDLTINAIAQSQDGKLHDPYGGIADISNRVLRHISAAFSEDPLRVLRVARFAARFDALGFRIAPETLKLMTQIVASGELEHLSAERVWLETQKALDSDAPHCYFSVLRQVGALAVLFPEVDALFGVPQVAQHHPEIDAGKHTLRVIEQAHKLASKAHQRQAVIFAALCHDLGQALSPQDILLHHYLHEQRGIAVTETLCKRLKVPNEIATFAKLVTAYHSLIHTVAQLRPQTILTLFNRLDLWRKPERLNDFLLVCEADVRGRLGSEQKEYEQSQLVQHLFAAAKAVDVQQVIQDGFEKEAIRLELDHRREQAIKEAKIQWQRKEI